MNESCCFLVEQEKRASDFGKYYWSPAGSTQSAEMTGKSKSAKEDSAAKGDAAVDADGGEQEVRLLKNVGYLDASALIIGFIIGQELQLRRKNISSLVFTFAVDDPKIKSATKNATAYLRTASTVT